MTSESLKTTDTNKKTEKKKSAKKETVKKKTGEKAESNKSRKRKTTAGAGDCKSLKRGVS